MSNVKGQLDTATGQTTKKIEAAFELQETVVRYRSEQRRGLLGAFAHDADTVAQAKERIKVPAASSARGCRGAMVRVLVALRTRHPGTRH